MWLFEFLPALYALAFIIAGAITLYLIKDK